MHDSQFFNTPMGNTITVSKSGSVSLCDLPPAHPVGPLAQKIKREFTAGCNTLSVGPTIIVAYNTIVKMSYAADNARGGCQDLAIPNSSDASIILFETIAIRRRAWNSKYPTHATTDPDLCEALAEAIGDNPPAHPLFNAKMLRALAARARVAAAACAAVRAEVELHGKSPAPFSSPAVNAIANAMQVANRSIDMIPPIDWIVSISRRSCLNRNQTAIEHFKPSGTECDAMVTHFARNYAGLHRERETAAVNARAAVAARQQASTKTGDVRALVARYHEADQAVRRYCTLFARVSPHLGKISIRYVAGAYMVILEKTDEYPGDLRHGNTICRD